MSIDLRLLEHAQVGQAAPLVLHAVPVKIAARTVVRAVFAVITAETIQTSMSNQKIIQVIHGFG